MCTVTIVPIHGPHNAFRMACSRDEQRGRALALPPQQRTVQGVQTLMPIDPGSEGTWVGVNEHGLALTLLNYNLPEPPTDRDRSRGSVIPHLLSAGTIDHVIELAASIDARRMMPFRLVACDGRSVLMWPSTEPIAECQTTPWRGEPVMFTSSGLGDHLVQGPRRELFDNWFGTDPADYIGEQQAFHRHRWPGREHLSVCMSRDDAHTVSYTTVDITPDRIEMVYHPDRPDRDAQDTTTTLSRRLIQR